MNDTSSHHPCLEQIRVSLPSYSFYQYIHLHLCCIDVHQRFGSLRQTDREYHGWLTAVYYRCMNDCLPDRQILSIWTSHFIAAHDDVTSDYMPSDCPTYVVSFTCWLAFLAIFAHSIPCFIHNSFLFLGCLSPFSLFPFLSSLLSWYHYCLAPKKKCRITWLLYLIKPSLLFLSFSPLFCNSCYIFKYWISKYYISFPYHLSEILYHVSAVNFYHHHSYNNSNLSNKNT